MARAQGRVAFSIAFDYGQRHRHEIAAAAVVAKSLGSRRHLVVPVGLELIGGSALTDPDMVIPAARAATARESKVPSTYVPARNLVFLSLAAAYAETIGASELWIGANAIDYSGYPDCREPFLRAFEVAARLGTRTGSEGDGPALRVVSPLVHLTKAEIIRAGTDLGVDYALTHSCYDPVLIPSGAVLACGRCESCAIRRAGFQAAGLPDPTRYAPAS